MLIMQIENERCFFLFFFLHRCDIFQIILILFFFLQVTLWSKCLQRAAFTHQRNDSFKRLCDSGELQSDPPQHPVWLRVPRCVCDVTAQLPRAIPACYIHPGCHHDDSRLPSTNGGLLS